MTEQLKEKATFTKISGYYQPCCTLYQFSLMCIMRIHVKQCRKKANVKKRELSFYMLFYGMFLTVTDERTNKKQTTRKFRISRKLCVTAQIQQTQRTQLSKKANGVILSSWLFKNHVILVKSIIYYIFMTLYFMTFPKIGLFIKK